MLCCGQHNNSYWPRATFLKFLPKTASNLRPYCRWWLMASCFTSHDFTAAPVPVLTHLMVLFFFSYVCQESVIHESGSDGSAWRSHTLLIVMDCHAKGSGGDNGSLQFYRTGKIGFLLPVAHYRHSLRFHQSGHMRAVRKTEWHKMSPELQNWGETERRNKQGGKGNLLNEGKTAVTDIIIHNI